LNAWLAWVAEQGCILTALPAEVHHIIGHGRLSQRKVDDLFVIPLAPDVHRELHNKGWRQWENDWDTTQVELWFRLMKRARESSWSIVRGTP